MLKAAIYQGKCNIEIKELPDPICTDDGVILQNIYASICGTDIAVYKHGTDMGHRITIGGEFGHEAVCRIYEKGRNVKGLAVGDRVYPYPRLVTGDKRRAGTIGAFSEYIKSPVATVGVEVYPINEKISDKAAALIEPFTVGCRAARRSFPRNGESAIVFGAGTIGISAAIALKHFGCDKVMVCDHSDFRLSIVKELGFEVCNNGKEDLTEKAMAYFGKTVGYKGETSNADIYVDAAGADSILDYYQNYGKMDSRLVIVAVGANERSVNVLGMTFGQLAIIGSGGYTPDDVKDVMAIMESGRWDIERIITHEYPLEQLEEAIKMAGNTDEALNVVIKY